MMEAKVGRWWVGEEWPFRVVAHWRGGLGKARGVSIRKQAERGELPRALIPAAVAGNRAETGGWDRPSLGRWPSSAQSSGSEDRGVNPPVAFVGHTIELEWHPVVDAGVGGRGRSTPEPREVWSHGKPFGWRCPTEERSRAARGSRRRGYGVVGYQQRKWKTSGRSLRAYRGWSSRPADHGRSAQRLWLGRYPGADCAGSVTRQHHNGDSTAA